MTAIEKGVFFYDGLLSHHTVVWGYLVYSMFFVCMITDLSAVKKDSVMKLCVLVRLLSGQFFSHFGELWLTWSHVGGITSGMRWPIIETGSTTNMPQIRVPSEMGAAPPRKAVWWDLCLASLLTHLFTYLLHF